MNTKNNEDLEIINSADRATFHPGEQRDAVEYVFDRAVPGWRDILHPEVVRLVGASTAGFLPATKGRDAAGVLFQAVTLLMLIGQACYNAGRRENGRG